MNLASQASVPKMRSKRKAKWSSACAQIESYPRAQQQPFTGTMYGWGSTFQLLLDSWSPSWSKLHPPTARNSPPGNAAARSLLPTKAQLEQKLLPEGEQLIVSCLLQWYQWSLPRSCECFERSCFLSESEFWWWSMLSVVPMQLRDSIRSKCGGYCQCWQGTAQS